MFTAQIQAFPKERVWTLTRMALLCAESALPSLCGFDGVSTRWHLQFFSFLLMGDSTVTWDALTQLGPPQSHLQGLS